MPDGFAGFAWTTPRLLVETTPASPEPPARIRLADYPQLKQLAWQIQGTEELTPTEALDIYERNQRHLDAASLDPRERALIDALRRMRQAHPGGRDV